MQKNYQCHFDFDEVVAIVKKIIAEICEAKRRQRIHPALATEVEIKHALTRCGETFTAESFKAMLAEIEADSDVATRRLLRYNGYELKTTHDADTSETNT